MRSSWATEALAVFRKEWLSESRSRQGLYTSSLFSVLSVVAMSLASFGTKPPPGLAAGMLCVTLVFSAVVSLPRSFLSEDEAGTFDLLRLAAEPSAAFFGKLLYNNVLSVASAALLGVLFVTLTTVEVDRPGMLALALLFVSTALAAGVSLCGAFAMGANNRWVLATAVAFPVLFPVIFLGMGSLKVALGEGFAESGWRSVLGLFGWTLALFGISPLLAAAAWKTEA